MTIKETAGKMLLYFYQLQRTVPTTMPYRQLGFINKPDGGISLMSDKPWLTKDMLAINSSTIDIFNAYTFLLDKGIVQSNKRMIKGKRIYVGVHVTSDGIDVVEGIEQGEDGRHDFTKMFNIAVKNDAKVEGLIEDNLKGLLDES